MKLNACVMTLLLAGAGLASAQSRVLYDPRLPTPEPRISETERGRVKYLADQAAQRGLWANLDSVPGGTRDLLECGSRGFRIRGVAPGAFTAKGAQQTAYLYDYCNVSHAQNLQGLVVLNNLEVAAHYTFTGDYYALYAVKDINRNGFTELGLEGYYGNMGTGEGWLTVAELQPGRRNLLRLDVYSDDCLGVQTGWKSQVIRVIPGATPQYTTQPIAGKCSNERVATSVGSIRPISVQATPTGWTPAPLK